MSRHVDGDTPNWELWGKLQGEVPEGSGGVHLRPLPDEWGPVLRELRERADILEQQRDAALELISRSNNLWLRFSRLRYRIYRWRKQGTAIWAPIGRGGRRTR